ncbi:MAG: hypothetical protein ACK4NA_05640 [Alphaproteobacteria bacterium]
MKKVSATLAAARSVWARVAGLSAAAFGLGACVATEPAGYYPAQTYYYSAPGYYYAPAPRPTYHSFSFSYRDDDDRRRRGHPHRGHGHHGHGHRGHR